MSQGVDMLLRKFMWYSDDDVVPVADIVEAATEVYCELIGMSLNGE